MASKQVPFMNGSRKRGERLTGSPSLLQRDFSDAATERVLASIERMFVHKTRELGGTKFGSKAGLVGSQLPHQSVNDDDYTDAATEGVLASTKRIAIRGAMLPVGDMVNNKKDEATGQNIPLDERTHTSHRNRLNAFIFNNYILTTGVGLAILTGVVAGVPLGLQNIWGNYGYASNVIGNWGVGSEALKRFLKFLGKAPTEDDCISLISEVQDRQIDHGKMLTKLVLKAYPPPQGDASGAEEEGDEESLAVKVTKLRLAIARKNTCIAEKDLELARLREESLEKDLRILELENQLSNALGGNN